MNECVKVFFCLAEASLPAILIMSFLAMTFSYWELLEDCISTAFVIS